MHRLVRSFVRRRQAGGQSVIRLLRTVGPVVEFHELVLGLIGDVEFHLSVGVDLRGLVELVRQIEIIVQVAILSRRLEGYLLCGGRLRLWLVFGLGCYGVVDVFFLIFL